MKSKVKSILLDIHPIFVKIIGLKLYNNAINLKKSINIPEAEIIKCIDDISLIGLYLLYVHLYNNSNYGHINIHSNNYYYYHEHLLERIKEFNHEGDAKTNLYNYLDTCHEIMVKTNTTLVDKFTKIMDTNSARIKELLYNNVINHIDYIYTKEIFDIISKFSNIYIGFYCTIFLNNIMEYIFSESNIHNIKESNVIYKNYIKRFNYITGYGRYLNFNIESLNPKYYQSINKLEINNIKLVVSTLKLSKSYYNSYMFIDMYHNFKDILENKYSYFNIPYLSDNNFELYTMYHITNYQQNNKDYNVINFNINMKFVQINLNLEKYIDLPKNNLTDSKFYKDYEYYQYKYKEYKNEIDKAYDATYKHRV